MATEKLCKFCGQTKPLSKFTLNERMADGFMSKCKDCQVVYNRKWRKSNSEKLTTYSRTYRAKYPQKLRANATIQTNVKRGKIDRKPCEVCGSEKADAHHDDYSRPMDVRWLCRTHHAAVHATNGRRLAHA